LREDNEEKEKAENGILAAEIVGVGWSRRKLVHHIWASFSAHSIVQWRFGVVSLNGKRIGYENGDQMENSLFYFRSDGYSCF
jgi:hypothetical protein